MELRHEDIVHSVSGALARAEAELRFRGWRSAVEKNHWEQAFSRVRGLARIFSREASEEGWRRLLIAGLEAASHANARGEAGRFVRDAAPGVTPLPFETFRPIFSTCARLRHDALAGEIGTALTRTWPESPVGWFARADAAERHAGRRQWRPDATWADDFHRAFERAPDGPWRDRIGARFVTARLRAGGERNDVRDVLAAIDLNLLDRDERHWLAYGLAHSEHWLDELRSCDMVDDALDEAERGGGELDPTISAAAATLFSRLPARPREAVVDRLHALLEHRGWGLERRTAWNDALQRRLHHAEVASQPITEASGLMEPIASFAALAAGKADEAYEYEGMAAHVADALKTPSRENYEAIRRALVTHPEHQWRALSAAWPRLISEAPDGTDETIDRLGRAWCERAPRPSYGWWALALHFDALGADEAAQSAAWRGIRETPRSQPDLRDVAIGKTLTRVVREADLETLLAWLEACEAIAKRDDEG